MKRFLVFLLIICSLSTAFAATATPGEAKHESESVVVSVTGGISDQKFIGVGFSKTAVPEWVVEPTHLTSETVTLTPEYKDNDVIAKYKGNDLFLYWRVLSDHAIDISLKIVGPMSNGTSSVDWNVSWSSKLDQSTQASTRSIDISSNSGDAYPNTKIVFKCPKLPTLQTQAGSLPLTIETSSLLGKNLSQPYSGELQLEVKVL